MIQVVDLAGIVHIKMFASLDLTVAFASMSMTALSSALDPPIVNVPSAVSIATPSIVAVSSSFSPPFASITAIASSRETPSTELMPKEEKELAENGSEENI